jgi:hypothetical protein
MAYHYLEQKNPKILDDSDRLHPLPDFRSIDLLRQAECDASINGDQQQELQKAVFADNLSHPTIAKRFKEMTMQAAAPAIRQYAQYKSALSAARRLQGAMAELPDEFLPQDLDLVPVINKLEQALELLQPQQEMEQGK